MTPGVRTEPELSVRIVARGDRIFVLEDEHYQGEVIGTRQLKADGSWTGWVDPPRDVVDETWPAQIGGFSPPNYTQVIGGRHWITTTTSANTTPFLNALGSTTSTMLEQRMETLASHTAPSNTMVVSPAMHDAITKQAS